MYYTLPSRMRTGRGLFGMALLLLSVSAAAADPKPLTKEEQAKVDQAIDKGVAFLKKTQMKQGDWPRMLPGRSEYFVGQTALPAYALLVAGVPADDPVIEKAAKYIRSQIRRNEWTYELSLALLFFDRLGDPQDKPLIRTLALQLIAGQHLTGGWNYRCYTVGKEKENELFQALVKLDKWQESGEKSMSKLLRDLRLPPALRTLTVFHDPETLPWRDPPISQVDKNGLLTHRTRIVGATDNSNTQFAMLGLWAAQRHDVPVGPTFRVMVERFERTQQANGWWTYFYDHGIQGNPHPRPSMICVGLLGLAIGRGLKLSSPHGGQLEKVDLPILKGLAALSQDIGDAAAGVDGIFAARGFYYLWSVERVAMLYNLPSIGDKDWYRWGAGILVTNQNRGGEWRHLSLSPKVMARDELGPILGTAFALLFLKRSHPMKELTPKLPFTAKELNEGIARLREGDNQGIGRLREDDKLLRGTTTPSRESRNPESQKNKRPGP